MSNSILQGTESNARLLAARIRGVTPQAIAGLIQRGHLTTLKVAGRVLVRRSEVENYTPQPGGRPRKPTADEQEAENNEDAP